MTLIEFLQSNPTAFTIVAAVLGLIVGSFLNVVAYRLPIMLERQWREQCAEFADADAENTKTENVAAPPERFDLVVPRSRCPHCGHGITAWENIPVLSYAIQKGRCTACGARISPRYPVVELVSGLGAAVVAWHFGFGAAAGAAMLLTWTLIVLSLIDYDHHLLPDTITLPLLWIGLLLSLGNVFTAAPSSIVGAAAGYLSLWLVYKGFKWLTGKEGMGYGDFKLFAALGAWMGWQALPVIILLASLVGTVVGVALIALLRRDRTLPIPFGPYLAMGGWVNLMWGQTLIQAYWSLMT